MTASGPIQPHSCNRVIKHTVAALPLNGSLLPPIQPPQPHQPLRMLRLHLIPAKPPFPVTFPHPRQVHAAAGTQAQHVLHGVNGRIGHACAGRGDELPVNSRFILRSEAKVVAHMLARRVGLTSRFRTCVEGTARGRCNLSQGKIQESHGP